MMKVVTWMAMGAVWMGMAWADPESGQPQVFPGQEDAMLRELMGEMLKEAEEDRLEMEKPVELPKIDAPELQRLLGRMAPGRAPVQRWMIGIVIDRDDADRIVVDRVLKESAAAEAGLEQGDVVHSVNGIRLRDHAMLMELLQVVRGQELVLGVRRGGKDVKVKVTPRMQEIAAPEFKLPDGEPRLVPMHPGNRDDAVLEELRGMRSLMGEMLKELKRQTPRGAPLPRSRVRQVPRTPSPAVPPAK